MLFRFCLYGFLKNQRYFEPFMMLILISLRFSFFQIGVLVAAREVTINLLEIPSGAIADVVGRRASMMISFVAYIISFLIFALSSDFWMFALAMLFYGVGDSFRTGTHKAMIFEWLRLEDRTDEKTKIYGLTRSWSKLGSALSGLIAAAFVFITGDYRLVFWFAMIPYAINLINFAGYPKALDGSHEKTISIQAVWWRVRKTFAQVFFRNSLRLLMLETICWEGYLAAVKDYLQPVLKIVAVSGMAWLFVDALGGQAGETEATTEGWFSDTRKVALVIGAVYSLIFIVSAWASRSADAFQKRFGGPAKAASRLWQFQTAMYTGLFVCAALGLPSVMIGVFVLLIVVQNIWRPILISRFDDLSEADEGATMLSIESQCRHASTFVFAPLLGWLIDVSEGKLWAAGAIGLVLALVALVGRNWLTEKKSKA